MKSVASVFKDVSNVLTL